MVIPEKVDCVEESGSETWEPPDRLATEGMRPQGNTRSSSITYGWSYDTII